ncbi:hypothetical protein ACHAXH_003045, partial [Discostella pseudostelligera]
SASASASASDPAPVVAAATVDPFSLSTIQQRYPRLFQMYATLSDREEGTQECLGRTTESIPTDPITGLYTKIFYQNFTEKLHPNPEGVPLKTDSEGNKYFHFVYRMFLACESGSCGGDACRLYEILFAALEGAIDYSSDNQSTLFEHLLGWTAASTTHDLFQLWDRAEPYRTQELFDWAAKEWKKLFEKTEMSGAIPGVSDEMRNFAIGQCDSFKRLVVGARKEWGDHAKYSFNFIKPKSRPPKQPVEKKPKNVVEKKTNTTKKSKSNADVTVDVGTSTLGANSAITDGAAAPAIVTPPSTTFNTPRNFDDHFHSVTVTVHRPDVHTKLGLGLTDMSSPNNTGYLTMKVSSISETSLFHNTELRVGMWISMIDGSVNFNFNSGVEMLQKAKGELTIDAFCPRMDLTETKSTAAVNSNAAAVGAAPDGPVTSGMKRKAID